MWQRRKNGLSWGRTALLSAAVGAGLAGDGLIETATCNLRAEAQEKRPTAREVVAACGAWQFQIVEPVIEAPLALCQSDHLPLSDPAQAVKDILLELVVDLASTVASTPEPELSALS